MKLVTSLTPSHRFLSLAWDVFFAKKSRGVSLERHFPFLYDLQSDNLFFELYDDAQFVGGVAVVFDTCHISNVRFAKIGLVCISPFFRGRGYFKKLFHQCIIEVESQGVDSIVLWTGQHELYSQFGFQLSDPYLFGEINSPAGSDSFNIITKYGESHLPVPTFSTSCCSYIYRESIVYASDFSKGITILDWKGNDLEIEMIFRSLAKHGCNLNILRNDSLVTLLEEKGYQMNLKSSRLQMQLNTKLLPTLEIKVLDRI